MAKTKRKSDSRPRPDTAAGWAEEVERLRAERRLVDDEHRALEARRPALLADDDVDDEEIVRHDVQIERAALRLDRFDEAIARAERERASAWAVECAVEIADAQKRYLAALKPVAEAALTMLDHEAALYEITQAVGENPRTSNALKGLPPVPGFDRLRHFIEVVRAAGVDVPAPPEPWSPPRRDRGLVTVKMLVSGNNESSLMGVNMKKSDTLGFPLGRYNKGEVFGMPADKAKLAESYGFVKVVDHGR